MRKIAVLLVLFLIFACASCGKEPNPWLEDYDCFWTVVEENFALYAAAGRINQKDYTEIREKYRPIAAEAQSPSDLKRAISGCVTEFQSVGHFYFVDMKSYGQYMSLYSEPESFLHRQMNRPEARAFYQYEEPELSAPPENSGRTVMADGLPEMPPALRSSAEIFYYPEDRAVRVAIHSMGYYEDDMETLEQFFREIQDGGYEHCIIDIRGNGGGSDLYWRMCVVQPNLSQPEEMQNYGLVKGAVALDYYRDRLEEEMLQPISELPRGELPALLEEDMEGITHFINYQTVLFPRYDAPLFSGRFWLLTDRKVYSSAEKLAIFCKTSGFATIVGGATGGDGVGVDPLIISPPNSGICVRFSGDNGLNADGSCNEEYGTQPDIPNADGMDALQTCLATIRDENEGK